MISFSRSCLERTIDVIGSMVYVSSVFFNRMTLISCGRVVMEGDVSDTDFVNSVMMSLYGPAGPLLRNRQTLRCVRSD